MVQAWEAGTDSSTKVKNVLSKWLQTYLKTRPGIDIRFFSEAPKRQKKMIPSVHAMLYTGFDEELPRYWDTGGRRFIEETHRVTVDITGDERDSDQTKINAVVSNIRQGLGDPDELKKLGVAGVWDVRNSAEDLDVADVVYTRPVTIVCKTYTYVKLAEPGDDDNTDAGG